MVHAFNEPDGPIEVNGKMDHRAAMARDDAQLKIRLPAALKADLEILAEKAGRSVNSEVVIRLMDSLLREHPDLLVKRFSLFALKSAKRRSNVMKRNVERLEKDFQILEKYLDRIAPGEDLSRSKLPDLEPDDQVDAPAKDA